MGPAHRFRFASTASGGQGTYRWRGRKVRKLHRIGVWDLLWSGAILSNTPCRIVGSVSAATDLLSHP